LNPRILFEDTHVCVLSKPAGLLSQGDSSGEPSLVDWLQGYFGRNYVGLVHRLDRNTSGVMVIGKRSKAADRLSEALRTGRLERKYLAWLVGVLPAPARWNHHLEKDERTNQVRVVTKGQGKAAILNVEPVDYGQLQGAKLTLARFTLETGRSHQIRVQACAEGYPLLGDTKYFTPTSRGLKFARPALHSSQVTFPHPMSKEILHFEDPLPADMAAIGTKLS
jgi:23S rRNA pseudouridine1911/1915/1917 synthase